MRRFESKLTAAGLWLGVASPLLYAAAQLLAAPLYPGYDWTSQLASELGTVGTRSSAIFNTGIVLSGVALAASAFGYEARLRTAAGNKVVRWLIAASLLSSGFASVWAGLHPLPAAIHNPGYWGIGTVAFPVLLAVALRGAPISRILRAYFAGTALATVIYVLLTSGLGNTDPAFPAGAMQRLGAFLVYTPVAIGALAMLGMAKAAETTPAQSSQAMTR